MIGCQSASRPHGFDVTQLAKGQRSTNVKAVVTDDGGLERQKVRVDSPRQTKALPKGSVRIRGRVLGANSEPLRDCTVSLFSTRDPILPYAIETAITEEGGLFELVADSVGSVALIAVRKPGYGSKSIRVALPTKELLIKLTRVEATVITVLGSRLQCPIASAKVTVLEKPDGNRRSGAFLSTLKTDSRGQCQIYIEREIHGTLFLSSQFEANRRVVKDFVLAPGVHKIITVPDAWATSLKRDWQCQVVDALTGNPIAGAEVLAKEQDLKCTTDGLGMATLVACQDNVSVRVSCDGYVSQWLRAKAKGHKQRVSLSPACIVVGKMVVGDTPVYSVTAKPHFSAFRKWFPAWRGTDCICQDGRFKIERVPLDSHIRLVFSARGAWSTCIEIDTPAQPGAVLDLGSRRIGLATAYITQKGVPDGRAFWICWSANTPSGALGPLACNGLSGRAVGMTTVRLPRGQLKFWGECGAYRSSVVSVNLKTNKEASIVLEWPKMELGSLRFHHPHLPPNASAIVSVQSNGGRWSKEFPLKTDRLDTVIHLPEGTYRITLRRRRSLMAAFETIECGRVVIGKHAVSKDLHPYFSPIKITGLISCAHSHPDFSGLSVSLRDLSAGGAHHTIRVKADGTLSGLLPRGRSFTIEIGVLGSRGVRLNTSLLKACMEFNELKRSWTPGNGKLNIKIGF